MESINEIMEIMRADYVDPSWLVIANKLTFRRRA